MTDSRKDRVVARLRKSTAETIRDNLFLVTIMVMGLCLTPVGIASMIAEDGTASGGSSSSSSDILIALGVAFIIPGAVGIYMMLATRQVAKGLHERFNDMNKILDTHTEILKSIASSQKEIASSQKEIASSQKETVSTLRDMASSLERIDKKLDNNSSIR